MGRSSGLRVGVPTGEATTEYKGTTQQGRNKKRDDDTTIRKGHDPR